MRKMSAKLDAMNYSVEHIAVPATDPVALKDWYVRVLDARPVWDNGQSPPTYLIALPGGVWLEIFAAGTVLAEGGNNKLAGWQHLALRVDSIDTAKAELTGRGVKFAEEMQRAAGGGRVLFFEDGEGNSLHLIERPTNSTLGRK
jgi:glyoxylase I family protein